MATGGGPPGPPILGGGLGRTVTRHGEEVVVVLSAQEYRRLTGGRRSFKDFLLAGPDLSQLDLRRDPDMPREVDL